MSYITYNGKMITSEGKYTVTTMSLPFVELFSFNTTGNYLYKLNLVGSIAPEDSPTWDMGDTSTAVSALVSIPQHQYSGAYVSPADKRVSLSMYNPSNANSLYIGDSDDVSSNKVYDIDLSNFPSLLNFQMGSNDLSTLDISNNPNISTVSLFRTKLLTLDLTNNYSISQIYVQDSSFKSLTFGPSNYPNLSNLNFSNNYMSSLEVSTFIDNIWTNRNKLTSGYKGMDLHGTNASLNFPSVHKVNILERDSSFASWASNYNVPNGIMRNYYTLPYLDSYIQSYFLNQTDNGIQKGSLYGNTITAADGSLVVTFRYSLDTSIADFQGSNVTWNLVTRYRKDTGDAYTTLDNTNWVCTSNTSGMTFQKDVSLYLSHVLGNKQATVQFQITLTDNRLNKDQSTGDWMVIRAAQILNDNDFNDAIVIGGNTDDGIYTSFTRDFIRDKWGA